jgi:hypothetical protein
MMKDIMIYVIVDIRNMKQLGFKTLKEYFEYLNYMKSKGFNIPL